MGFEDIDHAVEIARVSREAVEPEENDSIEGLVLLDVLQDRLDAGSVQVFSRISIVIHDAFIPEIGQFIAERIHHVFAVMGLGIKGCEIALSLIVGRTARVNYESFFLLLVWRNHSHSFRQHPYNTPSGKSR